MKGLPQTEQTTGLAISSAAASLARTLIVRAVGLQSSAAPGTTRPGTAALSRSEPDTVGPPASRPSSSLRVENLGLAREGQESHSWAPGEPTSIRFTLRVNQTTTVQTATFDFTADITARSRLGDNQRWPLGTTQGVVSYLTPAGFVNGLRPALLALAILAALGALAGHAVRHPATTSR